MSSTSELKLLAAARAARKLTAQSRLAIIRAYSSPPGFERVKTVTDPGALEWISEHDDVLKKLDAAIKEAKV